MNATAPFDAHPLATVTVTFNPDMALLESQLCALPEGSLKIIVDNASEIRSVEEIKNLVTRTFNANLLCNSRNLGLAAAVNQGVRSVAELSPKARVVLLLDQDSEPQPGSIEVLLAAYRELDKKTGNVGCVGPLLRDPDTGLTHGFHQCTRWRWKRVYPPLGATTVVECANLNGSGTLVSVPYFLQLGGLDEALFIDHVDTEWAFRVLSTGYSLWGVPAAIFHHRMGQASTRFWCFGWRVWPLRSPQRHYFLFRNAVVLMRRHYVPAVWKFWATIKLLITVFVTVVAGPSRWQQIRKMAAGAWIGLTLGSVANR
jgi:rhamnosyltransferase